MKINTKTYKLKDLDSNLAKSLSAKYNVKEEDIEFVRKGIPIEKSEIEKDTETGLMYISTKHTDRDGDIVVPSGVILDDYRKTPVVLWCHKYSMDDVPVGMNQWIKTDTKGLLAKTKYHTRPGTIGEKVYNYLKDGFPLACSIGFAVLEGKSRDEFHEIDTKKLGLEDSDVKKAHQIFTKTVLLEYSMVPVASNADSVVLSMKNFGISVEDEIDFQLNEFIKNKEESEDGEQKTSEIKEAEEISESGTSDSNSEEKQVMGYDISDEEIDMLNKSLDSMIPQEKSIFDDILDGLSVEKELSPIDEKSEEEIKFCDCSEFQGEEDNCKGCGGKRKPKKSIEEILLEKIELLEQKIDNLESKITKQEEKTNDIDITKLDEVVSDIVYSNPKEISENSKKEIKEVINVLNEFIGIEDIEIETKEITPQNKESNEMWGNIELEIEEKEFPIEIETKEIEFTDEEIALVVTKLFEERGNINYDEIIKESILKLKGRMF